MQVDRDYTSLDGPESITKVFLEAWNNRDPSELASLINAEAEFVNVTGRWWICRGLRCIPALRLEQKFLSSAGPQ